MKPGTATTIAAVVLAIATTGATALTASVNTTVVVQLMVLTLIVFALCLWLQTSRWIGIASIPMFGAVLIQAGFADEPSWIRSIIIGCLWFVTLELAWEAIERRSGDRYLPAVNAQRTQEVVLVVGIALVLGLVASLVATFAPLRSVLLQALVLGSLLCGFVLLLRHAAATNDGGSQAGRTSASRMTE